MAEAQNTNVQEQDINQLLKVRREKLATLQEAGRDPFQITKYDVTHHSTDIKEHFEELEWYLDFYESLEEGKKPLQQQYLCEIRAIRAFLEGKEDIAAKELEKAIYMDEVG